MLRRILGKKAGIACLTLILFTVFLIVGCSSESKQSDDNLNLFVAAGMKKPMDIVIEKFMEEKGIKIAPNYGPSGGLWAQIREDQPCDLYYSADWLYIEQAQNEGKLVEAKGFLRDNIVLVVSETGKQKIKSMQDLTKDGVTFAIGDAQAPVGVYAENSLKNLGLWDKVQNGLKARPSTVNQVAIMVKEDQIDAGLIYSSVANGNQLQIVETVDNKISGEIIFGVGVIKGGNEKLAKEFMEFAFKHVNEFTKFGWRPYE